LCLARHILTTIDRCAGAMLCITNPIFRVQLPIHLSHCLSEAHFFVYSIPSWNKFIVDVTLSIKENLKHNLAFALLWEKVLSRHSQICFLQCRLTIYFKHSYCLWRRYV
jgi:hypothetical protein